MDEEKKEEKINTDKEINNKVEEQNNNIYKEVSNEQKINNNENKEKTNKEKINNNMEEKDAKIKELAQEIERINKEKLSLEEQNKKLTEENIKLTSKLNTLKENILKLKQSLEKDIYGKLESKSKLLKETLEQKDSLLKQIESQNEEIKNFKLMEEDFNTFREKFDSLIKEKSNMDNITIKQEEKLKTLEEELEVVNNELKTKDERLKKLDEVYLSVIKVIEEHKKTIQNLKNKIKVKEAEENNKKIILFQKEQEIALLRSFINSYKNDIRIRLKNKILNINNINNNETYLTKKDYPKLKTNRSELELITNKRLEQKFLKDNNNNKHKNLPKISIKMVDKQTGNNNINDDYNFLRQKLKNEIADGGDDENIKDISNMMNKMIND